jgi:hypothetical protein
LNCLIGASSLRDQFAYMVDHIVGASELLSGAAGWIFAPASGDGGGAGKRSGRRRHDATNVGACLHERDVAPPTATS